MLIRVFIAALLLAFPHPAFAQGEPANLDFEIGNAGDTPPGWLVPTRAYSAKLQRDGAQQGQQCVRLASDAPNKSGTGNLMQIIDATPYRGKSVRLRAFVRVETHGASGQAQLWFREDCSNGKEGFLDSMSDRPIKSATWTQAEIVADLSSDASRLNFGLLASGGAEAWLDAVTLEVLANAAPPTLEAPRALTQRGVANLVAFAKLLGYVRYFHPSDEAANADWEALAIAGMREIESAATPGELADRLTSFFRPFAPTLVIYEASSAPSLDKPVTPSAEAGPLRVTRWRHDGVGIGSGPNPVYRSKRETKSLDDGKAPGTVRDPLDPLTLDLGGGVSCRLPITLFRDDNGTLPRGGPLPEKPDRRPRYSGNDRATRLADVALAWNIFQHFYPYFDVAKTDWNALLPECLQRAASDVDERAFLDTMKFLVAQLHDGHGYCNHPSETKVAVPPIVTTWVGSDFVIARAEAEACTSAGVPLAGAVITSIDKQPIADAIRDCTRLISSATPQWLQHRLETNLIAGPSGSDVRMELRLPDGKTADITLKRSMSPFQIKQKRPDPVAELQPGIWYVDIDRYSETGLSDEQWNSLAQGKGVIFDMRGYPKGPAFAILGHLTADTTNSAQWHIPDVTLPDRIDMKFKKSGWPIAPLTPRLTNKVIFLTGGGAISAAETFMGIVEHYKLGEIVGGASAGTNGNVNPFTLPGKYSLSWTGMKVLKHDGSQHHGIGIRPTVAIEPTVKGIAEGRDEVLEHAIEMISGPR